MGLRMLPAKHLSIQNMNKVQWSALLLEGGGGMAKKRLHQLVVTLRANLSATQVCNGDSICTFSHLQEMLIAKGCIG